MIFSPERDYPAFAGILSRDVLCLSEAVEENHAGLGVELAPAPLRLSRKFHFLPR